MNIIKQVELKSVLFYATVLPSVLGLFYLTSAYGEANLKAAPNINGDYLTTAAPPGCPADRRLVITIQQSGIYLNGGLELVSATDKTPQHKTEHALSGYFQPQVTLAGPTHAFTACQIDLPEAVVQGTIAKAAGAGDSATFTGQLTLNNSQPWQFTAERQTVAAPEIAH